MPEYLSMALDKSSSYESVLQDLAWKNFQQKQQFLKPKKLTGTASPVQLSEYAKSAYD